MIVQYLFLLEWEVAWGKTAGQSSTFRHDFPARNGNDQNLRTTAITNSEKFPYWYVDLQVPHIVKAVTVFIRQDCCGKVFPIYMYQLRLIS